MKNIISQLGSLYKSQTGSITIMWAVLLPVTLGVIGLGVETGTWYFSKRQLQTAADAAALAGARENTSDTRSSAARAAVVQNGFSASSNVAVSVNNPPASGSYTSNSNAVEVILSQSQNISFSSIFMGTRPTVYARAVAVKSTVSNGSGCVLSLANSGTGIDITGSATMNMPSCTLISNSSITASVDITGNSNTNVYTLYTAGNYSVGGSATFSSSVSPTIHGDDTPDPYINVKVPSYSGCDYNNFSSHSTVTLSPGIYCNGFSLNSHANVTLSPGIYIIDRGSFDIGGQATLSGTGVTIIFTSSTGSNYASATVNGGATVTLTAPTSGATSGIAFYQDRNAPTGITSRFNGGSTMDITGALYMPKGDLTFNGGNAITGSCTQIVSDTVSFSGNNNIIANCPSSGMTKIYSGAYGAVRLQE